MVELIKNTISAGVAIAVMFAMSNLGYRGWAVVATIGTYFLLYLLISYIEVCGN